MLKTKETGALAPKTVMQLVPLLTRYARALTSQDPEDLVQETVERALKLNGEIDEPEGYLVRMLRNLHLDRLRRQASVAKYDPDLSMVRPDVSQPVHDMDLALVDVLDAIGRLPKPHREILYLVAAEDLSYREISEALDVPVGTVTSRIARARAALATQLAWDDGLLGLSA